MITQEQLKRIVIAKTFLKANNEDVEARLLNKEPVEPGLYYAYVGAESKRSPKYKQFITEEFGPAKVYELINATVPTNYTKLCIGINGASINEKEK